MFTSSARHRRYLGLFCFGLFLQLLACAPPAKGPEQKQLAEEYRRQADQAIYEKRFADGVKLLKKVVSLAPNGEDYLLLGDLHDHLQEHRAARNSYQQGLKLEPSEQTRQALLFYWASLEALEFDNQEKMLELSQQLSENSAAAINLKVLQAIEKKHFDTALSLTDQITTEQADREMKGWAFFHAARIWVAVGNQGKAFEALFFAINHARGHGLVSRITRYWEELKLSSQPE